MLLSRTKPATQKPIPNIVPETSVKKDLPSLEEFLTKRDYTGALTMLEFERHCGKVAIETDLLIAYSAFHLGDYKRAAEEYKKVIGSKTATPEVSTYLACCYFFLGQYKEAMAMAKDGPMCSLQNRLLFHIAHKFNEDRDLLNYHGRLSNSWEDQLSLASIHYLRSQHQEAIDIYKRILLDNREYLALNVNIALCYYKIDYFDVSQEVLGIYLQKYPDSATAINLRACINFRLYNGKTAEAELKALQDLSSNSFTFARDLIRHNLVVFRGGECALQVSITLTSVHVN